ncbi:MAG: DNA gyrase inhibitor YacG [Pseudomonadota bacterium]
MDVASERTGAACPICGQPALVKTRPFCSTRCADIDLGRWLKEGYRVPTDEPAFGGDLGGGEAGDDDSNLRPASGVWRFH